MFGGCLEYLALTTGYRALLVVCAGLYLAAYLMSPPTERQAAGAVRGPATSSAG
jgi:hypothetical protein